MTRPPRVEQLEDRANPSTIVVTTLTDRVDGDTSSPAALALDKGSDGQISLTEAIRAAENDQAADTIDLTGLGAGTLITVDGSTRDPRSDATDPGSTGPSQYVITTPVTILGSGQTVARGGGEPGVFRLFDVRPGGSLSLDRLELRGGLAQGGNGFSGGGGAAGLGGAIFNQGDLTITNSTLTGNIAQGGAGSAFSFQTFQPGGGGGLGSSAPAQGGAGGGPNGGPGNSEGSGGFGLFGGGGGGGSFGSGGTGGFGGGGGAGYFGNGGDAGFGAGGGGGASSGSGGTAGAGGFGGADGSGSFGGGGAGLGGAVFNYGGTVRVADSTFFGNTARGGTSGDGESSGEGFGGGLFNLNGSVAIASSTFARNQADDGGAVYNLGATVSRAVGLAAAQFQTPGATLDLHNSIFVDSTDRFGEGASTAEVVNNRLAAQGPDATLTAIDPSITNQGGFRNDGGSATATGFVTATRPVVAAALADNGGPTRTLLPTPDSEAIDAGGATATDGTAEGTLTTDQRGLARVSGGKLDLGAVEVRVDTGGAPEPVTFTSPTGVTVRNAKEGAAIPGDPFPDFAGDTRVATADLDNDGFVDFVFAPGEGGGPRIRVIDGKTGAERMSFFGYAADFRGGLFLAVADFNHDGTPDIVTGAGLGGAPHVKVFDGKTGAVLASFYAADPDERGGVSVAAGDVTGDGTPDVVTGDGIGGDGTVRVIDGTKLDQLDGRGRILPAAVPALYQPYGGPFLGGLAVTVGRFDSDGFADVAVGPLYRAVPQVFVRSGPGLTELKTFSPSVGGGLDTGLRLAAADETGDGLDELIVTAGPGGGPHTEVIDPLTGKVLESYYTFDPASRTGFGVG